MAETKSVRLADALRVGEFRALWAADTISVAGDQLARVALSLLVYAQTSSALLTGLTYALTFVPAFLGGLFLSGLADRFPRRAVIITADLCRAGLAAAMAIPGLPLGLLWSLVGLLTLAAAPYKAAQLSLVPQVLEGDRYIAGMALRQISNQTAQIAGFLAGGALVAAIAPQGTLLLNSGTFVVSVMLVTFGVRRRPKPTSSEESRREDGVGDVQSVGRRLVPVFVLASLVGLWVVPEGLAAPYASALGGTAVVVGFLMAADPVGSVLGGWLATKIVRSPTLDSLFWPAVLAGIPLVVCFARPSMWISAGLWALSGAASTIFLVRLQAHLVEVVPDGRRGTVMGRISTCLQTSQGLAILGGGAVAEQVGPFVAVATAGAVSVVVVVLVALLWSRARLAGDGQQLDKSAHKSLFSTVTSWKRQRPRDPAPGGDGARPRHGSPASMATNPAEAQPPARGHRGKWVIWSRPRPAVVYFMAVYSAAALLSVGAVVAQTPTQNDRLLFGIIVGSGIIAAEVSRRVERVRRMITDAPHVNLSSVWTLSAAILLPSGLASIVVLLLYGHLWFRSWRRLSGFHAFRAVFNASNVVLCCHATAWLADRIHLRPVEVVDGWRAIGLFVVVIAAYFVLNSAIVAVGIGLLQSDRSLVRLVGKASENLLELATLCMGAIAVVLLTTAPPFVVLIYLPLYALHRSVLLRHFEREAMADAKTGLLNATTWQTLAAKELDRAKRNGTAAGLLMIKINNVFKEDEAEQVLRDRALRAVADTLRSETRSYDLSGRMGGEEFVVLLPGVSNDALLGVADRIQLAVRVRTVEGLPIMSVSIGVVEYPATTDQLDELLLAASNALFSAGPGEVCAVKRF